MSDDNVKLEIRVKDGKVILDFGQRPIAWIAFSMEQARQIADSIKSAADKCMVVGGNNG